MSLATRFGLRDTSEKTVEINTLSDLTYLLESRTGQKVTIISPTQAEENRLGFDEIIEGLPPGQVVALQFKRPRQLLLPQDAIRFIIDTRQLQQLLLAFSPNQAFYILIPFPKVRDLISFRPRLLDLAVAIDVYDFPNSRKTSQKTRTIRLHKQRTLTGMPIVEITDPWTFQRVEKINTLTTFGEKLIKGEVGYKIKEGKHPEERKQRVKVRRVYYLHLASP